MTIRVWHLGLSLLLILAVGGFYVTHQTSVPATTTPPASSSDASNAEANVRSLGTSIASYAADNTPGGKNDPNANHSDSGYTGMTIALVRVYDQAIPSYDWVNPTDSGYPAGVTAVTPTQTTYCAISKVGSTYAWQLGPTGTIRSSTSPASVCHA